MTKKLVVDNTVGLTLEDKRKLMLADVKAELQKYKNKEGMEWWIMRLEDKLNDLQGGFTSCR